MSLGYQGSNFLFQIVTSTNAKLPNSVRIVVNDHFLFVDSEKKIKFVTSDGPESKKGDFLDKTTFLLLEPACGKVNNVSFGHVINEDIGNNQTVPVLNYVKININYKAVNSFCFHLNHGKFCSSTIPYYL